MCKVIRRHRYSRNLPQGGLEIPCKLILLGKPDDIKNVNKPIKKCANDFTIHKFTILHNT